MEASGLKIACLFCVLVLSVLCFGAPKASKSPKVSKMDPLGAAGCIRGADPEKITQSQLVYVRILPQCRLRHAEGGRHNLNLSCQDSAPDVANQIHMNTC